MSKRQKQRGGGTLYRVGGKGPWIASWFTTGGKRCKKSTGTTDKATAARILAKLVADEALRKAGILDPTAERHAAEARRPIGEHLADFLAVVGTRAEPKTVRGLSVRVTAILTAIRADRLADVTPGKVQAALNALRADGRSLQTLNHHRNAMRQFSRWLVRDGRQAVDLLAGLAAYNVATDARYKRRALEPDEAQRLIQAAETGPKLRAVTGAERAMVYQVALGTGFRRSELAALKPGDFRLDDDPPCIILPAVASKHRKEDRQPIRPELADTLRPWLVGQPANRPAFKLGDKPAENLRADLRRARASWIRETPIPAERRRRRATGYLLSDAEVGAVDLHSLRATFVTWLIRGGANAKQAQILARHSSANMTLGVYTKLGIHDVAGGLAVLPTMAEVEAAEALKATGTDGSTSGSSWRAKQGKTRSQSATIFVEPVATIEIQNRRKPEQNTQEIGPTRDMTKETSLEVKKVPRSSIYRGQDSQTLAPQGLTDGQKSPVAQAVALPADLTRIIERWPSLPEPIRAAVVALVGLGGSAAVPDPARPDGVHGRQRAAESEREL